MSSGGREFPQNHGHLNPFPGLRSFEVEEGELYFGREKQIDQLLTRLRRARFLAVVGPSGCGKSSLVKAGLVAALEDGFMVEAPGSWRIAILRPGDSPIWQLATALSGSMALGSPSPQSGSDLWGTLRRGSLGIIEAVREASLSPDVKLLIVVDQFEELFRFVRSLDEAHAFVKLLVEASAQRELPIHVMLTMRLEYLRDCSAFQALADAINNGLYLVPPMDRDQLREAIEKPIVACKGKISNSLVNRLLNDLGNDPDQLPILQHALMRLWALWSPERPQREAIDLDHYGRIGTVKEALSRHADEAFGELDERGRTIAEILFRRLTETTPDNQMVRRPARLAEICQVAEQNQDEVVSVISKFSVEGRSFLVVPSEGPLNQDSVIDISHESLIRQWNKLREWAEKEADAARRYRRLSETASLWKEGKTELWGSLNIRMAQDWERTYKPTKEWASRYDDNFALAMEFLEQSRTNEEKTEEERRKKEEKERRLRRFFRMGVVLVCLT